MGTVYYTPEEIAKQFKVTRQAVYIWVKEGKLEATYLGRAVRISKESLEAFMRRSKQAAADSLEQ